MQSRTSRPLNALVAAVTMVVCGATVAAAAPGQPRDGTADAGAQQSSVEASPPRPTVALLPDEVAARIAAVSQRGDAPLVRGAVLAPRPTPPRRAPARSLTGLQYRPDLGSVQAAIDRCAGPAAWNGAGYGVPWLVIEHDYCGGQWVLGVRTGHLMHIADGPLAGTWRANGRTLVVALGSPITVVRGLGPLAAQTCVPGTDQTKFVGFDRVA